MTLGITQYVSLHRTKRHNDEVRLVTIETMLAHGCVWAHDARWSIGRHRKILSNERVKPCYLGPLAERSRLRQHIVRVEIHIVLADLECT